MADANQSTGTDSSATDQASNTRTSREDHTQDATTDSQTTDSSASQSASTRVTVTEEVTSTTSHDRTGGRPTTSSTSSSSTSSSSSSSSQSTSSSSSPTDSSSSVSSTSATSSTSSDSDSATTKRPANGPTRSFDSFNELPTSSNMKSLGGSGKADNSGLGTGQIIGISLAAFVGAGVILMLLGAMLRWRRRRSLRMQTAHLQRASHIWDLADTNGVEAANEKAAREEVRGGSDPMTFTRSEGDRSDSFDGPNGQDGADDYPPPAGSMLQRQPTRKESLANRLSNRLSGIFSMGSRAPAAQPPVRNGLPTTLYPGGMRAGAGGPVRMLERQNTFDPTPPPRNNFFPGPPRPQPSNMPLAMPGSM